MQLQDRITIVAGVGTGIEWACLAASFLVFHDSTFVAGTAFSIDGGFTV